MNRHDRRREKLFGDGRPRPMSSNVKRRLMRLAQAMLRPTEPGKHWGKLTGKYVEVLKALLWTFHNANTGLCFPSYESIAAAAGCDRSTVHKAIIALEEAGLLTWVHRLKRVHERVVNLFGEGVHGRRSRVLRTSNGYRFAMPPDVESSKSKLPARTTDQALHPLKPRPPQPPLELDLHLMDALNRLGQLVKATK
jgi:DNA-binding MarR family transcriptional regulator